MENLVNHFKQIETMERYKVYFESRNHAELIATFEDEDIYIRCLPMLEKIAEESGMIVTESFSPDEVTTQDTPFKDADKILHEGRWYVSYNDIKFGTNIAR